MIEYKSLKDFGRGITLSGGKDWETEEWIMSSQSTEDCLKLWGYDANLYPLPKLSERPTVKARIETIERLKKAVQGFDGEVWADDVRIK